MGKIYFAKMNINDEIYEVYEGKTNLTVLTKKIYSDINNEKIIYDDFGGRYKFFDIDKKENLILTGRLGYIKKGVHSTYDPDNDTAIDIEDKNKIEYCTFYFDVSSEMIGFNTKIGLNNNKFLEIFSILIKEMSNIGVVFILESDIGELEVSLNEIDVLKKIELKLVPPNGDKKEFKDLFSLDPDRYQEADITQVKQILSTRRADGLNKKSEAIRKMISGIGLGYAEGKFFGKKNNGELKEVSSKEDAPYTKIVPTDLNNNKSKIAEVSQEAIGDILASKTSLRERNKNERGDKKE